MTPLPFVWPYAVLFWAVFSWAFAPEFGIVQRARREQSATDSKSLQVIMLGQGLAFSASFPLAWVHAFQFAPPHRFIVFYIGVSMLVAGSLLRRHCFRMLGSSFTGDVRAHQDQKVIDRGAYRLVRHPAYSAGIILNTAVGVAMGSWGSAIVLGAASLIVYLYRISVEERALVAGIGEPYRQFMTTRKRLIPFIY